jgi:DNA repair protein SbcC/Rad50
MHVTRVEIENIKSYEQAEFTFERGITAIVGNNGAGKTTILEAIAWALFDNLDYSKDDFLRRGAKKGSVRVTFESDADQRQYTVYRDTGQGYYVFDPGLNLRIAEKKIDVSAVIRMHLGIEAGTDLKALFRSAIGVPQGSFTAEFLLPPNARKAYFDRLLKVEEYRESADNLRDTLALVRERMADVRERIAGAEGKLIRYDELVEEHNFLSERVSELNETLEKLQREIALYTAELEGWHKAKQRVTESQTKADRLIVECEAAERRLKDLKEELTTAQRARERQQATERDHLTHLEALDQLQTFEKDRIKRDQLNREAEKVALLQVKADAKLKALEEALQYALQAKVSIEEMSPKIAEQESLEKERERLRDLKAHAIAAQERLVLLDKELETLRKQHTQVREKIKQAEASRGAQAQVDNLESDRIHIENELARERDAITNYKHFEKQKKDIIKEIDRLRKVTEDINKELVSIDKLSTQVADLHMLESSDQALSEQIATLRAEIQHDEKMQREVKGGLCPILSERCLNMGEGQTLETYFKDQLATNRNQLRAVEQERLKLIDQLRIVREAEKSLSRLNDLKLRYKQEQELLFEREAILDQLNKEITKHTPTSPNRLAELQSQMIGIDAELKSAREAVLRYAELEALKERLREIEEEGKHKKESRAELSAAAAAITQLEADISEVESSLQRLNDPRGQANRLRLEAEKEKDLRLELETTNRKLTELADKYGEITGQLKFYNELDIKWGEATERRNSTLAAHREYLASETIAATLPAREAAYNRGSELLINIKDSLELAKKELEEALSNYDSEKHLTAQVSLSTTRERFAAIAAQLETTSERASSLQKELDQLSKVRSSLMEEFRTKERLEQLGETTDFIRDILKQAGPLVTESYLYNISIEANQLFREITGEVGRTLRWTRDYEILLEEEGHERPFANLSGGEQMAAALSVRLALLKQLSDIRIAFFDEPTVNMDAERRERLAQAIGQIRNFDQLFVISHDDSFEEFVDHIVHVEREGIEVG